MDKESKGIAWFGNIYRKLETVLAEVDEFASQNCLVVPGHGTVSPKKSNDAQGLIFVRDERKEVTEYCSSGAAAMQQHHDDDIALPSCNDPSSPLPDENWEISKSIHLDERVDGNGSNEKLSETVSNDEETRLRAPLLEEYVGNNNETVAIVSLQDINTRGSDDSQSSASVEAQLTCCSSGIDQTELPCNDPSIVCSSGHPSVDSSLIQVAAETPAVLVEENMAKMRLTSSNSGTLIGNLDDFCNDEHDAAPLETIELYDMANREDRSDVDDSMLYAVCQRTRKLRSFKKKIADALAPKRQREKEYEQLAIWFGDASMGSDLDTAVVLPSKIARASDTKRQLASEDSEWELL